MRAYLDLKIKGIKDSIGIDGINLTCKKDIKFGTDFIEEGADVYLDFDTVDYSVYGNVVDIRLKEATVQINGEETMIEDNSDLMYQILRNSKLDEVVVYTEEEYKNASVLGSVKFELDCKEVHLKSNSARVSI